jgi:tripartite-type tricarboxylate transporter receptor subunit TctC
LKEEEAMKRREVLKGAAGVAAVGVLAMPAIAQSAWPQKDKQLKVIVPWPPGAANDALGRLVADRLATKFGITTVTENRVGGAGLVGTKAVASADPDGYLLLASAFNTAVMPMVLKAAADFNPEVDLEMIARTAVAPLVCVMSAAEVSR